MTKSLPITIILIVFLISTHVSYSQELPNPVEESEVATTEEILTSEESLPTPEAEVGAPAVTPPETNISEETIPILAPEKPIVEIARKIAPQKEALKERKVTKKIIIDKEARHACEPAEFSIPLRGNGSARVQINLTRNLEGGLETLEIGSLPNGIDVTIDDAYLKSLDSSETSIPISISKQDEAQTGSFNIPIIYTVRSLGKTSVSICQINIVNNG